MPSLSVVLRSLIAERRYLGLYNAEVFLSASISVVQEAGQSQTINDVCRGDTSVQ